MKIQQLGDLETHLKKLGSESPSPVYLVTAKEESILHYAVKRVVQGILGEKRDALSLKRLEGAGLDLGLLMETLEGSLLLSARTAVLVSEAERLKKPVVEGIKKYLARPNPTVVLILSSVEGMASSALSRAVEKQGVVIGLAAEKAWEREKLAAEWLRMKTKENHKLLGAGVEEGLLKRLGPDLFSLEGEMEKLFCFVGERQQIAMEDVMAICANAEQETLWQLGEAVLRKDKAASWRIGRTLLNGGLSFLALLAGLRRQLEVSYQISSMVASGRSREEIGQVFPYMKGGILDKNIALAQSYGLEGFKRALIGMNQKEIEAKSSASDLDALAEIMLVQLAK